MSDIVSHGCCLIGHPFRYFLWKNKILEMVLAAAMSIALSVGISVRLKKCEVAGAQEIVDYGDNYSYFMFYSLSLFGRSASLSNLHVQRSTVFFKILFSLSSYITRCLVCVMSTCLSYLLANHASIEQSHTSLSNVFKCRSMYRPSRIQA